MIEKRLEQSLEKPNSTNKVRILIVDDENVNVYILEKILFKYNMEYDSCYNGKEAIKKVEENQYDVVLLDVMLPEMNGFEVCEYIHKVDPMLPVIILTSLIDNDSIRYSFKYGAVDYIKKPINEVELLSRIENVIKIRSAERGIKKLYGEVLKDLNLSSQIQKYLLPEWAVEKESMLAVSVYGPSSKVSGDLYDVIDLGQNRQLIYIADISGHGVHAALLMTAVKSLIQNLVLVTLNEKESPHAFLTRLNAVLTQTLFQQNYMTMLCCILDLDEETITVYNAGHPPILALNRKTETAVFLGTKGGCPLGWFKDAVYHKEDEEVFSFDRDSVFLLYTDGVFECMDERGEELGLERFLRLVNQNANKIKHPYLMPQLLQKLLKERGFSRMKDDFAMLKIENMHNYFSPVRKLFLCNAFLKNVGALGVKIEKLVLTWTGSALLATKSELVVNEFLNNIISHGFKSQPTGTVALEISYNSEHEQVMMKFYDKGSDWNFKHIMQEKQGQSLDRFASSGRGLLVIASLASRFVSYRYEDTNETIITLIRDEIEQEEAYMKSYKQTTAQELPSQFKQDFTQEPNSQ